MSAGKEQETTSGGPIVPKWMIGVLVAFFVVYTVTVLATGEPSYLIPVVILAVLVLAYAAFNRMLTKRIISRDGSMENAMSDSDDPVPSAHLIPDSETPLGDTPEAHDEISPHDLPVDHPGRKAAEEQAGDLEGTTSGDRDPSQAGERPR
ncbi:MAG: hypothetical protein JWO90_1273 [Solirubrobacterales bacterium]|jgi:hypothetical protein|nr:hypothetical protein [Solirubrobacterales bacterium]